MRKLFAVLATVGLIATSAVAPAAASHKSQSKHAHPDCGIEVDVLGVCLF
jgi:hypothetical protein